MHETCEAYSEIAWYLRLVAGSVVRMSGGTATSSFGGPALPQLVPVGLDEHTGTGGASMSLPGVKRENG